VPDGLADGMGSCDPAVMGIPRRLDAALLIVGGVLDIVRLTMAAAAVGVGVDPILLILDLIPPLPIGAGLIAIGLSLRRRNRVALIVAGVLELLVAVVNTVQFVAGSPLGPAPSQLAYYLSYLAVVVAAVFLLIDQSQHGPIRWALAIPAGCIVLFVLTLFALPLPWLDILPGVGFAVAGVILIARATANRTVSSAD
jgi:hypothetical protein